MKNVLAELTTELVNNQRRQNELEVLMQVNFILILKINVLLLILLKIC